MKSASDIFFDDCVEFAKQEIARQYRLPSVMIIDRANGIRNFIETPWRDEDERVTMLQVLKHVFVALDVYRYVHLTEVHPEDQVSLSNWEGRLNVACVTYEKVCLWSSQVQRHIDGRFCRLVEHPLSRRAYEAGDKILSLLPPLDVRLTQKEKKAMLEALGFYEVF